MATPAPPPPLPESVTSMVGASGAWAEDRVMVFDGEAVMVPTEDVQLVVGARWARNVDGKPFGQDLGLVQYLMERPDGTTRWSPAVEVE